MAKTWRDISFYVKVAQFSLTIERRSLGFRLNRPRAQKILSGKINDWFFSNRRRQRRTDKKRVELESVTH
jgi:hypothetical protein